MQLAQAPCWDIGALELAKQNALQQNISSKFSLSSPTTFLSSTLISTTAEIIELKSNLISAEQAPDSPDNNPIMNGILVRQKNQIYTAKDFYFNGPYNSIPKFIKSGKWVKGYDATFYYSSTGMGDCGAVSFPSPN